MNNYMSLAALGAGLAIMGVFKERPEMVVIGAIGAIVAVVMTAASKDD